MLIAVAGPVRAQHEVGGGHPAGGGMTHHHSGNWNFGWPAYGVGVPIYSYGYYPSYGVAAFGYGYPSYGYGWGWGYNGWGYPPFGGMGMSLFDQEMIKQQQFALDA